MNFTNFCSEQISFNFFQSDDVVRHPVVARIVNAYEKWEAQDNKDRKAAEQRRREEREVKQTDTTPLNIDKELNKSGES